MRFSPTRTTTQRKKERKYTDRSCASTPTAPKRCKTRIPEPTRPKIVCLLSKNGVGPSVIKNCEPRRAQQKSPARATSSVFSCSGGSKREDRGRGSKAGEEEVREGWQERASERMNEPLVFGPELAIARIPAPVNRSSGWISSSLP